MLTFDYTVYGYFAFLFYFLLPIRLHEKSPLQTQKYVPIPVLFSTVGRRASNGNNYMAQSAIPDPLTDSLSFAPLHYLQ